MTKNQPRVTQANEIGVLNLLTDAWLPVIRRSGQRCTVALTHLTHAHDVDPLMSVDWPRADFCVAALELLTGLLATACPPGNHHAWLDWWEIPPDVAALTAAFAPLVHAFELDGNGPCFMQDREALVSELEPIEQLLIEAPGASTKIKNTDLLVRRGRVTSMGRPAAAMSLYTFQSWAPAGGAGNRTGLRGGGPLVTMVAPAGDPTLWQMLWANVPCGDRPDVRELPRILPWLAPTLTSKDDRVVTPDVSHPLQCWWGMPRRVRLDFTKMDGSIACGLTGIPDFVAVTSWRQRPHGPNYAAWGGVHPLTPTYQQKPGMERLAVHPQPGGIGYRHWLGLVLQDGTGLRQPARTVVTWHEERGLDLPRDSRLFAAGYDMDNMKARGFVESTMPLPAAADRMGQKRLDELASRLVRSAELVANLLRSAVRTALFSAGATVRPDLELLATIRERLWLRTESAFFDVLARLPATLDGLEERTWHGLMRRTALSLFDEVAPMEPDVAPMMRQGETMPRLVRARRHLMFALQGFGKEGAALFTVLDLPAVTLKAGKKG